MAPTYSFIIPHRNAPILLNRCLNSIPTREDVQIIVVDDNSDTDKKPVIHREGVEIIMLDSKQSNGAGHARNVGLEKASGEWLLFPDCDDFYKEDFLDILDSHLRGEADVVYLNFEYLDGRTGEKITTLPLSSVFNQYDGSEEAKERVRFCNNVPWTKMVRREYVKKNDIHFEEVINGNDILFSMMIGYYTDNVSVITTPLYVYLRNSCGITSRITKEGALCTIVHIVQLNQFYKSICHPEWKWDILRRTLYYIKLCKIPLLSLLVKKSIYIYKHRNDWVRMINQH